MELKFRNTHRHDIDEINLCLYRALYKVVLLHSYMDEQKNKNGKKATAKMHKSITTLLKGAELANDAINVMDNLKPVTDTSFGKTVKYRKTPPNTVNCITNSPEVREFIDMSSVPVETDNIDTQKTTESTWLSLISSPDGETI